MRKGDKIQIYEKPITEELPWCIATLIRCERENIGIWDGRRTQRWRVRLSDGEETTVSILEPATFAQLRETLKKWHPDLESSLDIDAALDKTEVFASEFAEALWPLEFEAHEVFDTVFEFLSK